MLLLASVPTIKYAEETYYKPLSALGLLSGALAAIVFV